MAGSPRRVRRRPDQGRSRARDSRRRRRDGLTGTVLALETAQIALLADELSTLPHLLGLSRRAMLAIRENLCFFLGVVAIAVGLTIVGILRSVSGALLHELSSIPVIANSARAVPAAS